METHKRTAKIVGALFLISYFGTFAGGFYLQSLLDAPDMLSVLHTQNAQVWIGALLENLNGVALLGIAVMLYPVLKNTHEGIAQGYIAARVLEAGMQLLMSIAPLLMVSLSAEYVAAGMPSDSYFAHTSALLLGLRNIGSLMLLVFFVLGALQFYYLIYKSKLLPRFIPVWGFIALPMVIIVNLGIIPENLAAIFVLPIIANEIFVAFWLLIKGFSPQAEIAIKSS